VRSGSDPAKCVTPRTAQTRTKSFLGVLYMGRVWVLGPQQRYRAAWGQKFQSLYRVSGVLFANVSNVQLGRG
jgi:hypothetical protein